MSRRPLSGLRVIDFCWVGAGSYTTRILADLGADVVKIESGKRIDQIRLSAPFKDRVPGVNRSGYFADRNSGKRSVTVDLKAPGARDLVLELMTTANIVTSNFSPGTMVRLGLGYEDVRRQRPDVIYLEMSMQGASGPESSQVGYGMTIGALTGLQYLVGEPGRPPTGTGTNYPDHVPSPGHAAFAVLSAVMHWRKTGEGQHIDLAQTEATAAVLGPQIMAESLGIHQVSEDNVNPDAIFHDVVRTAGEDRYLAISVSDEAQWQTLLSVLDLEAGPVARAGTVEERSAVRGLLESRTLTWDPYLLMEELQRRGVPSGVVQNARDVIVTDRQLAHRGHWARLPHAEMGECLYNVLPFRFSRTDVRPTVGAPRLGEHTNEVLEAAGWSADEVQRLTEEGVLA